MSQRRNSVRRTRPARSRAPAGERRLIAVAVLVIVVAAASIGAMLALQYRGIEPDRPTMRRVTPTPAPPVAGRTLPSYEEPIEPAALPPLPKTAPGHAVKPTVPSPSPDGTMPAWRRNAVIVPEMPGDRRPKIAIVIDDLGVDRERGARAMQLPGPLTMAFLPYAHDLGEQTATARRAGHELLVHVPMEPRNPQITDPGPNALLVDLPAAELHRRLDWDLSRFDGYIGINNHMGSRFTADADKLAGVMADLRRRGLLFLDSRTSANSAGIAVARREGVPVLARDIFIDNDRSPDAIRHALAEIEQVARRNGHAIAIGHPHDATIEALAEWLPELARRGFRLVPLSMLAREANPGG